MSGRRIVDFARIAGASRSVAGKHVSMQMRRLDVYSKTSTLAKLLKEQSDRVTLPIQAASALAQKASNMQNNFSAQPSEGKEKSSIPSGNSVKGSGSVQQQSQQPLEQDHFYERSEQNSTSQPRPETELDIAQESVGTSPMPDGTIPPTDSPIAGTTKPSDVYPDVQGAAPSKEPLQQEHKEDELAPEASGRSSIPDPTKVTAAPTAEEIKGAAPVPGPQAIPEQDPLSEDMYSGLFHSRKVSSMLQRKPKENSPWAEIQLQRPREAEPQTTKSPVETDHTESTAREGTAKSSKSRQDAASDVQELANNLATEAHQEEQKTSHALDRNTEQEQPYQMHESRVPSSRFGRIWHYGGLATSMAFGAVGESIRGATGPTTGASGSLMLSNANLERLVAKLSRMRGAALKLGQMISFQDSKMLPAQIQQVLQRVQDSADYMPASQRNKVLETNLGSDWRNLFSSFEEVPMAAASIGQVHGAVLKSSGMRVAVKIQYPGVAASIDSDLNNISILLTASRILPKGLFLDKTITNARTELAWECDYVREAESAKRFASLLSDEQNVFAVPEIIDEASSSQVLTMECMSGVAVTKVKNFTQEQKDWVGTSILRLCLREIIEFHFMQTDPNWTNFLYNSESHKLELLDFGASRDYPDEFIGPYVKVLQAASRNDKEAVRQLSVKLGYLTGHESKAMVDAHVGSVLTLAEPFAETADDVYDFKDQTITDRVRTFIPVMLRERLAPPPEETYSLHRKLSGAFLLCARLGSRVRARELFSTAMEKARRH